MTGGFEEKDSLQEMVRQHKEFFEILIQAKVYEFRTGSVTLHFDHDGNVRKIETNTVCYPKKGVIENIV